MSVSSTGSGHLPDRRPSGLLIAATNSTSPASTSTVSGVAAGAGARSVASSGIPIVPSGPPSHTYRRPPAHRRSYNTASRCPRNAWNGCVTTSESHELLAPCALCLHRLLPNPPHRATPYLYSQEQIDSLIAAAGTLRTPHRVATMQTLFGLLAVTGMRIGEVVGLDEDDFAVRNGCLLVRGAKFGKSRELALHPSTVTAVERYLRRADRPPPSAGTSALLLTMVGTRLSTKDVQRTFTTLRRRAGIENRSPSCRPRLHDIRHSFAVATVLDAYRADVDVGRRLALLATYLGHVNPAATYWYLSAAPELMQLAADRLARHTGARS